MLKEIAKEKELQAKAKQTEAKQSNTIILRKERMKNFQQIKIRKEQVLLEKKTFINHHALNENHGLHEFHAIRELH